MRACYFCGERQRVGFWSYFCEDCANLRRMLLIYDPEKCCSILKRTLMRDDTQIQYKVQQEIKKIVNKEIEDKVDKTEDDTYEAKPNTRSSKKKKIYIYYDR